MKDISRVLTEMAKIPSTRGGRIRLLGLLLYVGLSALQGNNPQKALAPALSISGSQQTQAR